MAFMILRQLCTRGAPVALALGRYGAICAHSVSFRSVGYSCCDLVIQQVCPTFSFLSSSQTVSKGLSEAFRVYSFLRRNQFSNSSGSARLPVGRLTRWVPSAIIR